MNDTLIGWFCQQCKSGNSPFALECPNCGELRSRFGWLCPVCGLSNNPRNPTCVNTWGDGARHSVPGMTRLKILERDEWTCQECGGHDDLTVDHIHPVSWGGTNDESNLRLLCRSCNSSRGNRL